MLQSPKKNERITGEKYCTPNISYLFLVNIGVMDIW